MKLTRETSDDNKYRGNKVFFTLTTKNRNEWNLIANELKAIYTDDLELLYCPDDNDFDYSDWLVIDFYSLKDFKKDYASVKKVYREAKRLSKLKYAPEFSICMKVAKKKLNIKY